MNTDAPLLEQITPMIITFNEAPNLRRTLDRLTWARRILIIDSGSTDETLEIARSYPQVEIVTRKFDDFAGQCNFGLTRVATPWVLSLDADYELTDRLVAELKTLCADDNAGFSASFIYRIYGHALSSTLYPSRVVVYRVEGASYRNEGHGHRISIAGKVRPLTGKIYHDDRKPLARWLASQQRYARAEADYLLSGEGRVLGRVDRLRRMGWPAPILVFFYTLVWKRCLFDGWPGWLYVLQRTAAETMIALEIVDRKLNRAPAA